MKELILCAVLLLTLRIDGISQQKLPFLVDEINMFNYSLDTIFNLIPNLEDFDKIYVKIDNDVAKQINSEFAGHKVIATTSKRIPRAAKEEMYLNLIVDFFVKERGDCLVRVKTYQHDRNSKSLYGDGMYMLKYHFDDKEHQYLLTELIQGIKL